MLKILQLLIHQAVSKVPKAGFSIISSLTKLEFASCFCVFIIFLCPISDLRSTDWNLSVRIEVNKGNERKIKKVDLEEYTSRVLIKEVPTSWPIEVLKAQSIAIRTYAVYKKFLSSNSDYDLKDSILDQVYSDVDMVPERIREITESTKGQILTWRNEPAPAFYHSQCVGKTLNGAKVFSSLKASALPSVNCFPLAKQKKWFHKINYSKLKTLLKLRNIKNLTLVKDLETGKVIKIKFGKSLFTLNRFRSLLGFTKLKSPSFSFEKKADGYLFSGMGNGHAVGMSQWGAYNLAKNYAKSHIQILNHYYPAFRILKLYD